MEILVTGAAGFIGFHLSKRLLQAGHKVIGIDNINDYYDPALKQARLKEIEKLPENGNFKFHKLDIADASGLKDVVKGEAFTHVVNLAGQVGVRNSVTHPGDYVSANLTGFGNILECCRQREIEHLVFASSSSVYGLNAAKPYSIHQNVDHPVSLYAATKKSNELMAHSYAHLFKLPCTGLRFFTVYGPWGRPDMALYLFTTAILKGEPIKVFNNGKLRRDFTYVDDIVEGVCRILSIPAAPDPEFDPAAPDPASSSAPWRIYNIGNSQTIPLGEFIDTLEAALGKKAIKQMLPMQQGDVESTWADVHAFERITGFRPHTPLKEGVARFVDWYRDYHKIPE